jgi:hypothetical protein
LIFKKNYNSPSARDRGRITAFFMLESKDEPANRRPTDAMDKWQRGLVLLNDRE